MGLWRGEDTKDSVSGTYGITIGGVAFVPGEILQAFCFNGSNSYVEVPDSSALRLTNALTIEFWVRRLRFDDSVEYCIEKGGDWTGGQQNYGVALNRRSFSSCLSFHFADGWRGAGSVSDTNWHHCAVVARNGDTDPIFYIDGMVQPVVYREGATVLQFYPSARPLHLGAQVDPVTGWNYFGNVLLDEVGVYDRALSADEIQAIYHGGSAGLCPELPLPPSIIIQPSDVTVTAGNSTYFFVEAQGASPLEYHWFQGTTALVGQTNSVLTLTNVQLAQAGLYSVLVSNVYGVAVSSNAVLTVLYYPPVITLNPGSIQTIQGNDVLFRVQATGTSPLSYQWFHDGTPVGSGAAAGGQSNTLSLTNVQVASAGDYWATASNLYGTATSSIALLTVSPPPPCVAPPQDIVAWWRGENDASDNVGLNDLMLQFSGSPNLEVATRLSYGPGKVGTAFAAGTGLLAGPSVFALPSESLDVGSGDGFTVETWVKLPSGAAGVVRRSGLVTWMDGSGNADAQLGISGTTSFLSVFGRFADTNTPPHKIEISSTAQAVSGTWQHVALTYDHATGLVMLYLNGTNVANTNLGAFAFLTKTPVYVAAGPNGLPVVDEAGIYRRALSASEIQSIFQADVSGKCAPTAPACVPPPPGMVGWWRGESNTIDTVSGTYGNVTLPVLYTNGMAGSCFQFTNGWIRAPASPDLDVGTSPGLSVEFWVNPATSQTVSDSPYASLISWKDGTNPPGVSIGFSASTYLLGNSPLLRANLVDSLGHTNFVTSPPGLRSASSWQHIALTYDKLSGQAALYLDGHPVTRTNIGSFNPKTTGEFWIGREPIEIINGRSIFFTGLMDEIAVYNRALTEQEIAGIVAARGSGKCADPPAILTQPESQTVNLGQPAAFRVNADGTPVLHYQWLFNGDPITNATDSLFSLPGAGTNDAGTYSVIVSNQLGVVISSNAILHVNLPPTADSSATATLAISCNDSNATAVLDGSKSSDADGDALQYTWLENGNLLATGVVAVVQLPLDTNVVTLQLTDGFASDQQSTTIDVITISQAVQSLIDRVNSSVDHPRPLVAILTATLNSLQQGQCVPAIAQLHAFQAVVRAQVAPQNPALAVALTAAAEQIIQAVESCCEGHGHQSLVPRINQDHGRPHIEFAGIPGRLYLIEASTDLIHWQKIGVATGHDANFRFEDNRTSPTAARFYRIVPAE